MMGPPGCGRTMLAMRLPGLLAAEDGDAPCPLRTPHHTASVVAMFGAGEPARLGEVSWADYGIVFLNELPEFSGTLLKVLREPLEQGSVTRRRAGESTTLPARCQLMAAMNPCQCGACDETQWMRRCTFEQVDRYRTRTARTISEHPRRRGQDAARAHRDGHGGAGSLGTPMGARVAGAHRLQT